MNKQERREMIAELEVDVSNPFSAIIDFGRIWRGEKSPKEEYLELLEEDALDFWSERLAPFQRKFVSGDFCSMLVDMDNERITIAYNGTNEKMLYHNGVRYKEVKE